MKQSLRFPALMACAVLISATVGAGLSESILFLMGSK